MSLSIAINNALSGLAASQQGLSVISQNVANANTEGYSRKIANQSTIVVGGVGNGVNLDNVTRLTDSFLATEVQRATSADNKAQAISQIHQLAQNLFGAPGNNLSIADDLSSFNSALETLANNPENAGLHLSLVNAANQLAGNVRSLADSVQSIRHNADQEIGAAADRANVLLKKIGDYNDQISRGIANGLPTADLEDQRDLAVTKLAGEVDIETFTRSDGRLSVLTSAGVELVGDSVSKIVYNPASSVNASTVFGNMMVVPLDRAGNVVGSGNQIVSTGVSSAVTTSLTGGRIAGLLQIRDKDLNDFASQVEAFATMLRDQVNAVHNQGSGYPPPNSLTGTRGVAATDAFQGTGTVRIAVTDGAGKLVSKLDLDLTTLGATTVSGVLSAINTALAGTATAAISTNGVLTITANSSSNGIAINDVGTAESTTGRGFSHYFGLNDLFTGTTAADFAVNTVIAADPSRVAAGQLSTTALVGESAIGVGDNRNAQALAALSTAAFNFSPTGGLGAQHSNLGDYAATIISLNAARATAASDNAEQKKLIFENVQNRLQSQTGVNVDEELATMVVFQNSFVMAARVLKAASEMLDTLNQMVK